MKLTKREKELVTLACMMSSASFAQHLKVHHKIDFRTVAAIAREYVEVDIEMLESEITELTLRNLLKKN